LNEELELVETLLKIAVARLGPRMKYKITIPPALRSLQMPPLLLQPLVENAIQHGIEPALSGGEIAIVIAQRGESLELVVTDNGVGLRETARKGVGLDNIRARLASLYGNQGTLALFANKPRGVTAKLTIPAANARRPL
jgi:sensor histidine kinase YesM